MKRLRNILAFLVTLVMAAALPAAAAVAPEFAQSPAFKTWSRAYEDLGGDRNVVITVTSSRAFVTERLEARGLVRLDLIRGRAAVELQGLDRPVDVYLLDNKPGPGKSVLPEDGDVLLRLARLGPAKDGGVATAESDFGPEYFRGVEVNWILVADAGADPARSRLLYGTRSYPEVVYTRLRLAAEGFEEIEPAIGRPATLLKAVPSPGPAPIIAPQAHEILVKKGLVSKEVFEGGFVFFHEVFEGNGRSCGTCHPPQNNQTVDPAFMATLPNSDPLFVAENPPTPEIANLERPPLMRNFGLILENIDGLQDPNVKFVMRSVPHSLSMSTSITSPNPNVPPMDRTGWSGDGAPNDGKLIDFLFGAIVQHYPKNSLDRVFKEDVLPFEPFDFRMPTDRELLRTNDFLMNAGRTNELVLTNVSLTDTNAETGRGLFLQPVNRCNGCHENASANISGGINFNFDTGVETVPNPAQGFMGIFFPSDGGLGTDPFDCDGLPLTPPDCFGDGTFNTAPLVEAADTGPFFHNDVALTIEDATRFYTTNFFGLSPAGGGTPVPLDANGVNDVAAFLRVINAGFNLDIAIQRNRAVLVIDPEVANAMTAAEFAGIRGTANRLLQLSNAEIEDAVQVLTDGPLGTLNPAAVDFARKAFEANREAVLSTDLDKRKDLVTDALEKLRAAKSDLGTGLNFMMGTGNLLF